MNDVKDVNSKKQKLLIEYLLSSTDTFALCQGIIKSEYFLPEFRSTLDFVFDYYQQHSTTPNADQVDAETGVELNTHHEIISDQLEYCSTEIEKFCKHRAMQEAILASVHLINDGDYGKAEELVKDAILVSLTKNLGLDYFNTVESRLERMLVTNVMEPTGWSELDDALYGGLGKGQLTLVSANSGGGKSVTLANLGLNFAERGLYVLYLTLELDEDNVGKRFDTMITGISAKVWQAHVSEIIIDVTKAGKNCGGMMVRQMPTATTSIEIRAYLKEYKLQLGKYPDMLIVDYLDEMAPNEKVSADNVWEKDKRCSSQLRQILVDFDMYGATASQLNRSAVNADINEHNHSQIAGGISKINVADTYWSIIMTDEMRKAGVIVFKLLKTRNSDGVGKVFELSWNTVSLRIRDKVEGLVFNKKAKPESTPTTKTKKKQNYSDLLDL